MAQLPNTDRRRIWRGLMRYASDNRTIVPLDKDELRAAVDATDAWIDNNAASYNLSLPLAAQQNLSAAQKTILFCAVALARVNISFLRGIFGEVN